MGPEIDITDKMSSRANESGFVFLIFPAALLCFVYCRRACLWRKDPTDDAFSIPCVRLWSTDDEKSLFIYVQCQPWCMRRMETRKITSSGCDDEVAQATSEA